MKFVKILSVIFIVLLVVAGGISYWIYNSLHTPHQHNKADKFIQIPKGSTPNEIIGKLYAEGVLASELPTQIYIRSFGEATKMQAGEFSI